MLAVFKDRYEVERELGRGGMSVVYLAKDRELLARRVVIKVLLEGISDDAWVKKRFLQEMEALARIDHPGVVGVLDTGQTDEGKQFLVMQYVEGDTLRKALDERAMPFPRAASILRQIGQALAAAHEKGVWHRDLKPDNVMLQSLSDGEERVMLIDFGIAGIQDSAFSSDRTQVAGSSSYMAPEQFAGAPAAASDTYALGAVAYEMLTGQRPFPQGSFAHLVSEEHALPTPPRELRPDLPEAAEKAIQKAMSFQPAARQARIRDAGEDLFKALTLANPTVRRVAAEGSLEMAHVLFMDLVSYSLLPMDQQKDCLSQLQKMVRESPRFCAAEASGNIVTLPTGDGMALAFFGDPTAPAQCALELAAVLKSRAHLRLRMGIHSGPVYRIADVNANANVAGGGINLAKRVMDCGDPGHILVSGTVAEVLLQLSQWAPCLTDLGEQTVKHGVSVHLYNLTTAELGNPAPPKRLLAPGKAGRTMVIGLAAVMLVLAAAAGWWLLRSRPSVKDALQLAYSIDVQKYRDGKTYESPFRLAGEMVFENDYGIAVEITSQQSGYLYILNEGPHGKTDRRTFTLLEPRAGDSALRAPATPVRIPPSGYSRFDQGTGREMLYLIWARQPVEAMERLKTLLADHPGASDDADQSIRDFLAKHFREAVEVRKDDQAVRTDVRTGNGVLVHAIPLEHR